MSHSMRDEINSILDSEPLVASELYNTLEAKGFRRSSVKSTVGRLIDEGGVQRLPLRLGRGNTILYRGTLVPSPKLLKNLVENGFYGRESLVALIRCIRTSHPVVSKFDVAKIAALEIGRPDEPEWDETNRTIAGLVSLGVLTLSVSNFGHDVWIGNKQFLRSAGLSFSRTNVNPSFLMIRERVRTGLANALAEWLQRNTILGFGTAHFGNLDLPIINYVGLPFDILGFSFLSGVVNRSERITGKAVVGDVLIEQCNEAYAKSFVHRVRQTAAKTRLGH